jgi:hypothetical protein
LDSGGLDTIAGVDGFSNIINVTTLLVFKVKMLCSLCGFLIGGIGAGIPITPLTPIIDFDSVVVFFCRLAHRSGVA